MVLVQLMLLTRGTVLGHSSQLRSSVVVTVGDCVGTLAPSFVAHGWEPWMATQAFSHFHDPAFITAFAHLRGQTVRFGGITADWLDYVANQNVSAPCFFGGKWGRQPFTPGGSCPFSTGAFDALLRFLDNAGVRLLFDLNVLTGRNCTQPEPHHQAHTLGKGEEGDETVGKGVPDEWCGEHPAPWDTTPVRMMLEHIRKSNLGNSLTPHSLVGFELGNELFAPKHITRHTADGDIATAAELLRSVWSQDASSEGSQPPRLYATGTNDCQRRNNSDTMTALLPSNLGMRGGFSWHSYPGNAQTYWNKSELTSFLLNASWLRHEIIGRTAPCLRAWNDGPRAAGVLAAVTEAAAMCGYNAIPPGKPTTSSFIHGTLKCGVIIPRKNLSRRCVSQFQYCYLKFSFVFFCVVLVTNQINRTFIESPYTIIYNGSRIFSKYISRAKTQPS